MRSEFLYTILIFGCLTCSKVTGHEFRAPEEPGFQLSGTDEESDQTDEDWSFYNCASREALKLQYVEACAIFKDNGKRHLDCRHKADLYDQISQEQRAEDRANIVSLCGEEAYENTESIFSKFMRKLGF